MPIFRMRKLGGTGVVTDLPAFDLPQDAWTKGINVRFFGGKIQKMGGNTPVFVDPSNNEEIISVCQRPNTDQVIYGTRSKIYSAEGSTFTLLNKIKPDLSTYTYDSDPSRTWYYTSLSNVLIMNTRNENPQGLTPTAEKFTDIPGWGKPLKDSANPTSDWKANIIRSYKDYLIVLGITENGIYMPQRVRWSDVAYVNELPTNWHEDDPNTDGGFNDLSNAVGEIVDGLPLLDKFIIYTDRETFIMDYIAGDFVFNFRKLFSNSGLLAPECVCEFEGKHFVITENDVIVHNGSSLQSVASSRVKDYLINEISSVNPRATKVFAYPNRKEVWVQYVSPGNTNSSAEDGNSWACDKVAIWNWEFNTWYFHEISQSYDLSLCKVPEFDPNTWESFGDNTWESEVINIVQWGETSKTFKKQLLYSASADKMLYLLDVGKTFTYGDKSSQSTRPVLASLERTTIDMDEAVEELNRHKMITGITPQFSGSGTLRFYSGGSNMPDGYPSWDESVLFTIGDDYKVDCFTNYRYPAIKIEDSSEGLWNLTSLDLSFVLEGTR